MLLIDAADVSSSISPLPLPTTRSIKTLAMVGLEHWSPVEQPLRKQVSGMLSLCPFLFSGFLGGREKAAERLLSFETDWIERKKSEPCYLLWAGKKAAKLDCLFLFSSFPPFCGDLPFLQVYLYKQRSASQLFDFVSVYYFFIAQAALRFMCCAVPCISLQAVNFIC